MDQVSLIKEDDVLYVRWQMPVQTLIEYRHILAKCASILKCSEAEVPDRIQTLIVSRDTLLQRLREREE